VNESGIEAELSRLIPFFEAKALRKKELCSCFRGLLSLVVGVLENWIGTIHDMCGSKTGFLKNNECFL
jgi:hypothetical protein